MNLRDMYSHIGLARWCRMFGYTRQAFYQQLSAQQDKSMEEQIIIQLVKSLRIDQPRLGVRKLYVMLEEQLNHMAIKVGRDALFDLLSREGLLVKRRRRKFPQTTNSSGWFKRYEDLTIGFITEKPCQLWVTDITYITMQQDKFMYLSLITDVYSHQIVGWSLQDNLTTEGPMVALKQAFRECKPMAGLIHHSDRGSQYRSFEYVNLLQDNLAKISMTQSGDPRENPVAERVNGIIKNELLESKPFTCPTQAHTQIENAIRVYNQIRPHSSCQMLTPNKAAQRTGVLIKTWKKKSYKPRIV